MPRVSSLHPLSSTQATKRRALLSAALVLAVGLLPPDVHPLAAIPAILLGLLIATDLLRGGLLVARGRPAGLPLAVAAGLAALSSFLAFQPLRSVRVLITWLLAGLIFVAVRSLHDGRERKMILLVVVAVAVVQAGAGLWQASVGFPAAADAMVESEPGPRGSIGTESARLTAIEARLRSGRATGFLGIPALLASLVIMTLPAAAGALPGARGLARGGWIAALVVLSGGLVATRSLGGAAALALSAIACSLWWSGWAPGRRRLLLVLLILAVVAAGAPRFMSPGDDAASRSLSLRAGNWRAALSMIAAHPAAGTGPGNFGVAYPAHRPPGSNETQHAHNSVLEAVSDMGLPMTLLLGLLLAGFIRGVARSSTGEGLSAEAPWARRGLAVGALAWALQNLVDFSAYVAGSVIPFMALAGLVLTVPRDRAPELRPAGGLGRGLLAVAMLAALLFTVPDALSRNAMEGAIQRAREGESGSALRLAESAARWNPWEAEARATLALALLDDLSREGAAGMGRREMARRALVEALEAVRLDPVTANRRMILAQARSVVGDGAGAFASISMAARLNRFRPEYARERDRLEALLVEGKGGAP